MKKKMVTIGVALTMAVTMLAGCGPSKKEYLKELDVFTELAEIKYDTRSAADIAEELTELVEELETVTPEGEILKESFAELAEIMTDSVELLENYTTEDATKLEKYVKKIENLGKDLEDNKDSFIDAAEDAGVEKADFDDLDDANLKKLMSTVAQAVNGTRQKDYTNDTNALLTFWDSYEDIYYYDSYQQYAADFRNLVSGLSVSTPDGRYFKSYMFEVADCLDAFAEMQMMYEDDYYYYDEYWDISDEYDDCWEEAVDALEEFLDAAEDTGADSGSLDDLWDYYYDYY